MNTKSLIVAIAMMLALPTLAFAPAATAHFPPWPWTYANCKWFELEHDWVLGGGVHVETLGYTHGMGAMKLVDGSVNCPLTPLCNDVSEGVDVDGDGSRDTPYLIEKCTFFALVPGSDHEYELGIGGVFLSATHHLGTSVTVTSYGGPATFVGGSDGDGDSLIDGSNDDVDCLSGIHFSNGGPVKLIDQDSGFECFPGKLDGGWWIFIDACGSDMGDDGEFRLDDTNGDGIPDGIHFIPPTTTSPAMGCGLFGHAG